MFDTIGERQFRWEQRTGREQWAIRKRAGRNAGKLSDRKLPPGKSV
ncbi:hypothetical protein [Yoonia sp. 2307UL14-13]